MSLVPSPPTSPQASLARLQSQPWEPQAYGQARGWGAWAWVAGRSLQERLCG